MRSTLFIDLWDTEALREMGQPHVTQAVAAQTVTSPGLGPSPSEQSSRRQAPSRL